MERLIDDCIIMDYGRILLQRPVGEILDRVRRYTCRVPEGAPLPGDGEFYHPSVVRSTLEFCSFLPYGEVARRLRGFPPKNCTRSASRWRTPSSV